MLDLEAALLGLRALMLTIPELQDVTIGAPESLSRQVVGWVTVGDPGDVAPWASSGVYQMPVSLICWFGYAVGGAEGTAEQTLADYISELTRRLIRNRLVTVDGVTENLNGSVDTMGLPHAAAGSADYATMAGQETRVYPLGVEVLQRETITS